MTRRHKRTGQSRHPARDARPLTGTSAADETGAVPTPREGTETPRRRLAARTCGWCDGPITIKATGRLPKWCSRSCRQRAWEQSRAAASGLAAVRVVERRVEIPTPVAPGRQDWPRVLGDLARQLENGRIYDRDLLTLADALNAVHDAYNRRPFIRSLKGR